MPARQGAKQDTKHYPPQEYTQTYKEMACFQPTPDKPAMTLNISSPKKPKANESQPQPNFNFQG